MAKEVRIGMWFATLSGAHTELLRTCSSATQSSRVMLGAVVALSAIFEAAMVGLAVDSIYPSARPFAGIVMFVFWFLLTVYFNASLLAQFDGMRKRPWVLIFVRIAIIAILSLVVTHGAEIRIFSNEIRALFDQEIIKQVDAANRDFSSATAERTASVRTERNRLDEAKRVAEEALSAKESAMRSLVEKEGKLVQERTGLEGALADIEASKATVAGLQAEVAQAQRCLKLEIAGSKATPECPSLTGRPGVGTNAKKLDGELAARAQSLKEESAALSAKAAPMRARVADIAKLEADIKGQKELLPLDTANAERQVAAANQARAEYEENLASSPDEALYQERKRAHEASVARIRAQDMGIAVAGRLLWQVFLSSKMTVGGLWVAILTVSLMGLIIKLAQRKTDYDEKLEDTFKDDEAEDLQARIAARREDTKRARADAEAEADRRAGILGDPAAAKPHLVQSSEPEKRLNGQQAAA